MGASNKEKPGRTGHGRTGYRRGFLRASTVTATGLGSTVAVSGEATAGTKKCGSSDPGAPASFPWYDLRHRTDHGLPWGVGEMTLYINGWQSDGDRATSQAYETSRALETHGYWGEVVGALWDSVTLTWGGGTDRADDVGNTLADLVVRLQNDGTSIRLIGHSLGARVVGSCLNELADRGRSITAAVLLGGAIDDDSVVPDCGWWCTGEFHAGIRDATGQFDNYHSHDDTILRTLYPIGAWGTAIGRAGASGSPPWNYTDHDVTARIGDEHCDYYTVRDGCMDQVVANW